MNDRTPSSIGAKGEAIAAIYLKKQGYKIMEQNVRFGRDEIDIVAFDRTEKMIVFIEVKTRSTHDEKYPIRLAVDARKKHALRRAVNKWCLEKNYDGPARIDVICVHDERVVEHNKELGAVFL